MKITYRRVISWKSGDGTGREYWVNSLSTSASSTSKRAGLNPALFYVIEGVAMAKLNSSLKEMLSLQKFKKVTDMSQVLRV